MKKLCLIITLLILGDSINAQRFEGITPTMIVDGKEKINGFAGGVQNPQISGIELNGDGLEDMFVFESYGARILPYLAVRNGQRITYEYAPEYLDRFPELTDWALIRDFNGDGKGDIFASTLESQGVIGVEVHRANDQGGFDLVEMVGKPANILYYTGNSGSPINVYVSHEDIPDINDIDGDGDMDILSFEPNGSILNYYRNVSVERGLGPEGLEFEVADICWGGFLEAEGSDSINLSPIAGECASGFKSGDPTEDGIHAGSTTVTIDQDKDGDRDIVIGDLTSDKLIFLENGGTPDQAWMVGQDTTFPSYDVGAKMNIFLGSFFYDINKDGVEDFIVAPNDPFWEDIASQWYYVGFEQNGELLFSLEQTNLLTESMIDLGTGCSPTFVDFNQDGLMDIVAGNDYTFLAGGVREARLVLFENTGSITEPEYTLIDEDYLNMSRFSGNNTGNSVNHFAPAFGDLDGDNDEDLMIGTSNGKMFYLENTAGANQPFQFAAPIVEFMGIDVGGNCTPAIYDVDEDGLGDLVIGEKLNYKPDRITACSSIRLFKNIGSVNNPIFDNDEESSNNDPCFSQFPIGGQRTNVQATPFFYDFPSGPRLYVGSRFGIHVFDDVTPVRDDAFTLLNDKFGELYTDETHRISLADIDGDGLLEALIGHKAGGMTMVKTDHGVDGKVSTIDTKKSNEILLENPVRDELILLGENSGNYRIVNMHGQSVQRGRVTNKINVSSLSKGVYILVLSDQNQTYSTKWIKS